MAREREKSILEEESRASWQIECGGRRGTKARQKDQEERSPGSNEQILLTRRAEDGGGWVLRGREGRELWLVHIGRRSDGTCDERFSIGAAGGRAEPEVAERSSVWGDASANAFDTSRERLTECFGRRLMAAGGLTGGAWVQRGEVRSKQDGFVSTSTVKSSPPLGE